MITTILIEKRLLCNGAGKHGDAQWSAFDFRKVHMVESTVREI